MLHRNKTPWLLYDPLIKLPCDIICLYSVLVKQPRPEHEANVVVVEIGQRPEVILLIILLLKQHFGWMPSCNNMVCRVYANAYNTEYDINKHACSCKQILKTK